MPPQRHWSPSFQLGRRRIVADSAGLGRALGCSYLVTLVLIGGNRERAFLACDRQITGPSTLLKDRNPGDYEKSGVVMYEDGRFAYAFVGLCLVGSEWDASRNVAEILSDSAAPDFDLFQTIERIRQGLSKRFTRYRRLYGTAACFSLVMVGYNYSSDPTCLCAFLISNYEDRNGKARTPNDEFITEIWGGGVDQSSTGGVLGTFGSEDLIAAAQQADFEKLIREVRPFVFLRDKAVEVIRDAAVASGRTAHVGRRCTVIEVPHERSDPVQSWYIPDASSPTIYFPTKVVAKRTEIVAIAGQSVSTVPPAWHAGHSAQGGSAIAGARPFKNAPCPCGSGRKYKRCHGRPSVQADTWFEF